MDAAQELTRPKVARLRKERRRCRVLQDAAAVHEQHPRPHLARELHLMRHHQHRHAVPRQRAHHLQDLPDELGIQRGRRFVEQHEHRLHRHGTGDRHTLLLAARQLRRPLGGVLRHAHSGKLLGRQRASVGLLHPQHAARADRHVVERGEMGEQVEPLEHHADALTPLYSPTTERKGDYGISSPSASRSFCATLALIIYGPYPLRPPSFWPGVLTAGRADHDLGPRVRRRCRCSMLVGLVLFMHRTPGARR